MPVTLSSAELETIREIVGDKLYSYIEESCVSDLNDTQRTAMSADVVLWNAVRDKHLRMKGGRDGIDLDAERSRRGIRNRVRARLALPVISSGLFQIPVGGSSCEYD